MNDAGVGQSISFQTSNNCNGLVIMNGYQKSESTFSNNARVKQFAIRVDDTEIGYLELDNRAGEQHLLFLFQLMLLSS